MSCDKHQHRKPKTTTTIKVNRMKVLLVLFVIGLSVASLVWAADDNATNDNGDGRKHRPRLSELLQGEESLEKSDANLPELTRVSSTVWEMKPPNEPETNWCTGDGNEQSCIHLDRDQRSKIEQEYEFMHAIQLGIAASLTHSHNVVDDTPTKPEDYEVFETMTFKKTSGDGTPGPGEFKFQALVPHVFSNFRKIFGVTNEQYQKSIGDHTTPLKILGNPGGVSGSSFYLTHDGQYIIKTMQHREAKLMSHILPKYYANLQDQSHAMLLPKLFGQYCYISPGFSGKYLCFIVMNNLFPANVKIHQKYDLKGSTVFRRAPEKELAKALPAYRDLDFLDQHETGFLLDSELYDELLKSIEADIKVLASFKIMDYSLLIGVHKLDASGQHPPGVQVATVKSLQETRSWAGIPATDSEGKKVLLFVGIIDILQTFRVAKKLEFAFKSVVYDRNEVSVTEPNFYAQRFRNFIATKVFKRVGASGMQLREFISEYEPSAEAADDFDDEEEDSLFEDDN